ncbi:MAG: hypothetical protein NCA08_01045 [Deltaproteobacteria bacterium]|nr:hypothetical protein [Candidatus Deferrimicrobium borealis]
MSGVRGEAMEAPLHDEALDQQERDVPDDEGDEKPRDGRSATTQERMQRRSNAGGWMN